LAGNLAVAVRQSRDEFGPTVSAPRCALPNSSGRHFGFGGGLVAVQARSLRSCLSPRWGCIGCLAEPGLTPGPIVCRPSGADGGSRGVRRGRRLRGLSGWDARRGFGFHDLRVLSVEAPMRAGTAPNAHFHLAGPGRVPGGRRAPVNRRLAHPGTFGLGVVQLPSIR